MQNEQRATSIIISGDFNWHHPMWGGNHIPPRFIEDASELITFFKTHNLSSCLPRDLLVKCHLYHENYGSDHRATYSEWDLQA
ncbi:hypothetical protein EYZ11_009369 [Aspergillus tanneri]|uniref:Endonuclease/exonuclease/phosphatase domain-containing protein n=1 Tax=Aspergillus tanneri TaxID=1220188 RepID=A0A4S3J8B3_9EURO|nr:hypothetical protein EYZ11_009369 [Aspergillus tanneri]